MKFVHKVFFLLILNIGLFPVKIQAQENAEFFFHTITKGQSLYSIASMYQVSIDDIVRLNPGSDKQIRAGEKLKIPQAKAKNNKKETFHTIQAGETLYQLTVKYNITAQAICEANPGLNAKNFRIGQVIVIPFEEKNAETEVKEPEEVKETPRQEWKEMHKVARKETIFSISKMYGITQEELIAANPELKHEKLKRGTFLFIPYPKEEKEPVVEQQPTIAPSNEELFRENREEEKNIHTIKAAVLLPFMTGTNTAKENQTRMVEFYEGFLLAVDSLKRQGISLDIYAFDTQGKENTLRNILQKEELKNMNIIFGPAQSKNIKILAEFAEKNKIRLVVPFMPKVDEVFSNPMIYQINTPQSYLYSEVYEHFIRKFNQANIVFLDDGSNDREKTEFIKGLKNELKDNNIRFNQIRLGNEIDANRVIAAMDTLQENIFIPLSGENTTLTKIIPHLTLVRKEHPHFNMHLFGYPEWQTYTQDYISNFYELDTYFYSSFYTNNLFPAAINFTHSYRKWYSKDMSNMYPKYGMLGFDIGYFFLKGLAQEGNKLEESLNNVQVTPIQTGFKFERVNNWGGFINRKVFFVHFTKDFELVKLDFE